MTMKIGTVLNNKLIFDQIKITWTKDCFTFQLYSNNESFILYQRCFFFFICFFNRLLKMKFLSDYFHVQLGRARILRRSSANGPHHQRDGQARHVLHRSLHGHDHVLRHVQHAAGVPREDQGHVRPGARRQDRPLDVAHVHRCQLLRTGMIYKPQFYIPPDHLLLDRSPNIGTLISRWELDKFKHCWNKSFRTSIIPTLLYQPSSNLLIPQRDMSGPRLGKLSNVTWSVGGGEGTLSSSVHYVQNLLKDLWLGWFTGFLWFDEKLTCSFSVDLFNNFIAIRTIPMIFPIYRPMTISRPIAIICSWAISFGIFQWKKCLKWYL